MPLLLKFLGCAVLFGTKTMKRLITSLILCLVGCAPAAVRVAPEEQNLDCATGPAKWEHTTHITRPTGYGADEFLVLSDISDTSGTTPTVRYTTGIRVASLGIKYVATQNCGSASETLEIRLRNGDTPETLHADFDHSVRHGTLNLRFAGTTVLPRWGSE